MGRRLTRTRTLDTGTLYVAMDLPVALAPSFLLLDRASALIAGKQANPVVLLRKGVIRTPVLKVNLANSLPESDPRSRAGL